MAKEKTPDAISLLKADHRAVEELFSKFEKARGDDRKAALAKQICNELIIHTIIEEEIFYPAVRGAVEDDLMDESYVEHDGAKVLIAEILMGKPGDDFFDAKVSVLSEEIKHHVKEEEKPGKGVFAQAKKGGVDLMALGQEMAARKAELKQAFAQDGAAQPQTRTFTGAKIGRGTPPAYQGAATGM